MPIKRGIQSQTVLINIISNNKKGDKEAAFIYI